MNKRLYSTLFVWSLVLTFVIAGCVQPGIQSAADAGVQMTVKFSPDPPIVGDAELAVMLVDTDGAAITDAILNVQGDMTHAGMVPVIRDVDGGAEDGIYHVPFEWTMGGDWIVTVLATLADGIKVEQSFEQSVAAEGEMAHDAMDHGDDKEGDEGQGDMAHEDHDDDKDTEHEGHDDDMMDSEFAQAVEMLDVKSLHALDEQIGEGGGIHEGDAETVMHFQEALGTIPWPETHHEDVAQLQESLSALLDALNAGDVEAVKPLATTTHELAHDLKNSVPGIMGGEDESEGHSHSSGE